MKIEMKAVLALTGVLVLGYLAKITEAGKGLEEFLGGIGRGVSEMLSIKIQPALVPEIGLKICAPWAGLPCTVSSRDTGAVAGGGSASAGFQPRYTTTGLLYPAGATGYSYQTGQFQY